MSIGPAVIREQRNLIKDQNPDPVNSHKKIPLPDMKVLYHTPLTPPKISGTDAVFQEIELLSQEFGHEIINWFPFSAYSRYVPPFTFGLHNLIQIWKKEQEYDIHHIFHSIWYPFPLLFLLRKPVVYTVAGGFTHTVQYAPSDNIHLVLSSLHEQQIAQKKGWKNTSVMYPGIETETIHHLPPPSMNGEFVLLAGSAPWDIQSFTKKGFDLMLTLVKNNPRIRLISLWRGVLFDEWKTMIEEAGVGDRVEVYNNWVDIALILPRIHAAIVLADRGGIVKAWPHSLLEALTAGRPVLISRTIPMSSYIQEQGNGVIIENMTYKELESGFQNLITEYPKYLHQASQTGESFSYKKMIHEYERIYNLVSRIQIQKDHI